MRFIPAFIVRTVSTSAQGIRVLMAAWKKYISEIVFRNAYARRNKFIHNMINIRLYLSTCMWVVVESSISSQWSFINRREITSGSVMGIGFVGAKRPYWYRMTVRRRLLYHISVLYEFVHPSPAGVIGIKYA